MIKVNHLYKSFEGRLVLEDVSVVFDACKTNLIIGASGSGKTVLLKSLVGLHDADSGEIWFDDIQYNTLSFAGKKKMRQQIGLLFQGSALFDFATVEENIMFPMNMFTNWSRAEKLERVNFCLQRVRLENVNHLYPSALSGGMQKRVGIARAIALNPRYLFCDEPNSGLDPRTSIVIDELIHEITHEFGMTTIINTHDMNSVLEIGEKVIFIYEGKKRWEGASDEILRTDNAELNHFVFASKMAQQLRVKSYEL
ncbi:MAG: ATP-binding cassette domain-containing protein [Prevotellaceae bacterium]|jgi:phospholipid/cholesterol/gamma-HCH transport system ATP-binding protein|nr:ATP-binding cassette domain-containing protein [Prevotellaceae bacterium]